MDVCLTRRQIASTLRDKCPKITLYEVGAILACLDSDRAVQEMLNRLSKVERIDFQTVLKIAMVLTESQYE